MMETVSPYCGLLLSREISRLVKRLRFYIGDFSDKYGSTLNMLKVLEEKIESVHLDDMEVRGRCKPKMELPYSEWIWELFRASKRVAGMLEVMDNAAAMENEVPASESVSHWLGLDENLLSMKYKVGSLTSICARGELLVAFPGPSKAESSLPIAVPSPVKSESPPISFPSSTEADSSPTAFPTPIKSESPPVAFPSSSEAVSSLSVPSLIPNSAPCSNEAPSQTNGIANSIPNSGLRSLPAKPSPMASQPGDPSPIPCSGETEPCLIAHPSSDPDPGLQSLQAKPSPMASQHGDPSPVPCSGEPKPCLIARPSSDPDPGLQSLKSKPKLMASQLGDRLIVCPDLWLVAWLIVGPTTSPIPDLQKIGSY